MNRNSKDDMESVMSIAGYIDPAIVDDFINNSWIDIACNREFDNFEEN